MGRTPRQPTDLVQVDELRPELVQAERTMAALEAAYSDERDLINRVIGRSQMVSALNGFLLTVGISQLAFVKENKLYRSLKGMKNSDGRNFSGTWEEFCELSGTTRGKADEDIAAMRAFGEKALESMQAAGIGYRELRDFRRLPDDERTALVQVAETGDKDALLDLAEQLIARKVKQQEEFAHREKDLRDLIQAKDRVLADKSVEIDKKATEIERLKADRKALEVKRAEPKFRRSELLRELIQRATTVELAILGDLHHALKAVTEHATEIGIPADDAIAGCMGQIQRALAEVTEDFQIKAVPDGELMPMAEIWAAAEAEFDALYADKRKPS